MMSILRKFLSSSSHLIVKLDWNRIPPWKPEDFLRATDPTRSDMFMLSILRFINCQRGNRAKKRGWLGGAFVVWRTDLYIAEANRQLAEHKFYEKIPSDATQSSQQQVKSFIETAIRNNQLPPSATNLIVRTPTYLQILLVT